jgi:hypothetical protein
MRLELRRKQGQATLTGGIDANVGDLDCALEPSESEVPTRLEELSGTVGFRRAGDGGRAAEVAV